MKQWVWILILALSSGGGSVFAKDLFVVRTSSKTIAVVDQAPSGSKVLAVLDIASEHYGQVQSVVGSFVAMETSMARFRAFNHWIATWRTLDEPKKSGLKIAIDVLYALTVSDPFFQLVRTRWHKYAANVDRYVLSRKQLIFRSVRPEFDLDHSFLPAPGIGKPIGVDGHTLRGNIDLDTPWQSYTTAVQVAEVGYNHVVNEFGDLATGIIALDRDKLVALRNRGDREVFFVADSLFDRLIASLRGSDTRGLEPLIIKDHIEMLNDATCRPEHSATLKALLASLDSYKTELLGIYEYDGWKVEPETILTIEDVGRLSDLRKIYARLLMEGKPQPGLTPLTARIRPVISSYVALIDYRLAWLAMHHRGEIRFWLRFYQWLNTRTDHTLGADAFVAIIFPKGPMKRKRDPFVKAGGMMVDQSHWQQQTQMFFDALKSMGIEEKEATEWFANWKSQRHFIERKYQEVIVFQGIPRDIVVGKISRINPNTKHPYPLLMPRFLKDPIYEIERALARCQLESPMRLPGKHALVTYRMARGQVALMPRVLVTKPVEELLKTFDQEIAKMVRMAPVTTVFAQDQQKWAELELIAYENTLRQLKDFAAQLPEAIPETIPESELRSWDKTLEMRLTRFTYSTANGHRPYELFTPETATHRAALWLKLTKQHLEAMQSRIVELKQAIGLKQYESVLAETRFRPGSHDYFREGGYYVFRPRRDLVSSIQMSSKDLSDKHFQVFLYAKNILDTQFRIPSIGELRGDSAVLSELASQGQARFEETFVAFLGFSSRSEFDTVLSQNKSQVSQMSLVTQVDPKWQTPLLALFEYMIREGKMMSAESFNADERFTMSYFPFWVRFGSMGKLAETFAQVLGFESFQAFQRDYVLKILDTYYQTHGRFMSEAQISGTRGATPHPELASKGWGLYEICTILGGQTQKTLAFIQDEYAKWKGYENWQALLKNEVLQVLHQFYQTHGRFIQRDEIVGMRGSEKYHELARRDWALNKMCRALGSESKNTMAFLMDAYARWRGFRNWDSFWKEEMFLVLDGFFRLHGRFLKSEQITGARGTQKYFEFERRDVGLPGLYKILGGGSKQKNMMVFIKDEYAKWKGYENWGVFWRREVLAILDEFYRRHGRFIRITEVNTKRAKYPELVRRDIGLREICNALGGERKNSIGFVKDAFAKWKGYGNWDAFMRAEALAALDEFLQSQGHFLRKGDNNNPKYQELVQRGWGKQAIYSALGGQQDYPSIKFMKDAYAEWKGYNSWEDFWTAAQKTEHMPHVLLWNSLQGAKHPSNMELELPNRFESQTDAFAWVLERIRREVAAGMRHETDYELDTERVLEILWKTFGRGQGLGETDMKTFSLVFFEHVQTHGDTLLDVIRSHPETVPEHFEIWRQTVETIQRIGTNIAPHQAEVIDLFVQNLQSCINE